MYGSPRNKWLVGLTFQLMCSSATVPPDHLGFVTNVSVPDSFSFLESGSNTFPIFQVILKKSIRRPTTYSVEAYQSLRNSVMRVSVCICAFFGGGREERSSAMIFPKYTKGVSKLKHLLIRLYAF